MYNVAVMHSLYSDLNVLVFWHKYFSIVNVSFANIYRVGQIIAPFLYTS